MKPGKRNFYSSNRQRMMQGKMLATATLIRIINVIVLFIINILLSRLAGAAGYGILSLLIANASIFNLVSSLGADSGITFNTASNRIGIRKILSFIGIILTLQLVLLFIVEGLCWLMTGHFFLFKSAELENWWLGPLFLVSISLVEKYTALLQGQERFLRVNVVILIANLLLALILTSFYFTADDLPLIAYIQVYVEFMFLQALFLMIAFHRGAKMMGGLETPRRQDISFFFSYSIVAFVTNIIQFLAYRVDYWLLDHYKGETELGWYSLAIRLSQFFWILPLFLASIIMPLAARKQEAITNYRLHALVRFVMFVNIMAGILTWLLAPSLIPALFGIEFEYSVPLLLLLLPGVILFCLATLLAAFFAGRDQLKINLVASSLCLVIILGLDLWLIPEIGSKGAALASSIGYSVTGLYYLINYCLQYKVRPAQLFIPTSEDRKQLSSIFESFFTKKKT